MYRIGENHHYVEYSKNCGGYYCLPRFSNTVKSGIGMWCSSFSCTNMQTPFADCATAEERAVIRFLWSEEIKRSVNYRRMLAQQRGNCVT